MKFIVIDQDLKALYQLMRCLEEEYPESEIEPFFDPMLAVKYAYNHSVDAVFTELNMKRLDGFEVKRLIQGVQAKTMFYYITGDVGDIPFIDDESEQVILKPISKEKVGSTKIKL